MCVQEDPLVATALEVMLFLTSPPDGAMIEFTVLAHTEFSCTNLICGECFRRAVELQKHYRGNYGYEGGSDSAFVKWMFLGGAPVSVGKVFWSTDAKCAYCSTKETRHVVPDRT